jgi:hypothetical protein
MSMEELEPVVEIQRQLGARVRVRRNTELSERLMLKFPFTLGRIDWLSVSRHVSLVLPSSEHVAKVLAFLEKELVSAECVDSWAAYIGDSMDEEYEVERSALPVLLQIVESIPDHKYIFSLDGSWCLMWSMEGHVDFGLAPAHLKRRRRKGDG